MMLIVNYVIVFRIHYSVNELYWDFFFLVGKTRNNTMGFWC